MSSQNVTPYALRSSGKPRNGSTPTTPQTPMLDSPTPTLDSPTPRAKLCLPKPVEPKDPIGNTTPKGELSKEVKQLLARRTQLQKDVKTLTKQLSDLHNPDSESVHEAKMKKIHHDTITTDDLYEENRVLVMKLLRLADRLPDRETELMKHFHHHITVARLWDKYEASMPVVMMHVEVRSLRELVRQEENRLWERQPSQQTKQKEMVKMQEFRDNMKMEAYWEKREMEEDKNWMQNWTLEPTG